MNKCEHAVNPNLVCEREKGHEGDHRGCESAWTDGAGAYPEVEIVPESLEVKEGGTKTLSGYSLGEIQQLFGDTEVPDEEPAEAEVKEAPAEEKVEAPAEEKVEAEEPIEAPAAEEVPLVEEDSEEISNE